MLPQATDNDGRHVSTILSRTDCTKHHSPVGIPCWHIPVDGYGYLAAICGLRAKRAGFVGQISPTSLQQNTAGGRNGSRIRGNAPSKFKN